MQLTFMLRYRIHNVLRTEGSSEGSSQFGRRLKVNFFTWDRAAKKRSVPLILERRIWPLLVQSNYVTDYGLFSEKLNGRIFKKLENTLFWVIFWQIWSKWKLIWKRVQLAFRYWNNLTSRKNMEKSDESTLK